MGISDIRNIESNDVLDSLIYNWLGFLGNCKPEERVCFTRWYSDTSAEAEINIPKRVDLIYDDPTP